MLSSIFLAILSCKPVIVSTSPNVPLTAGSRKLVWNDEFDKSGKPDEKKWKYDVGGDGWGNKELQHYIARRLKNARVEDGKLIIETHLEKYLGKQYYTSARLSTKNKAIWTYGRIEVLAKIPKGRGTWPAIWMLGNEYSGYSSWPKCGEIDIMEHVGFDEGTVHGSVHTQTYNHLKNNQKKHSIFIKDATADFHLYAIEWTADEIDFFIDEVKYFTVQKITIGQTDAEWPFDKPFFLILNIAVGGNWGGQKGIDNKIFPQRLEIDYVRIFQ